MQKKLRLLIAVLALILILGGAYAGYHKLRDTVQTPDASAPVPAAESFADCTFYNENGDPVALSSLLGKPVLLNFWATWCPYCLQEFPDLQHAYEALGDRVNFVMVDYTDGVRETVEGAKRLIEENGYTFPVYYDKDSSALNAYGIYSFPTTVLLRADGTVSERRSGPMTYETVTAQLEAMLAGQ